MIPSSWQPSQNWNDGQPRQSLGSFDCNAQTKIIADSSPVGLRTVLLQERKGENPVIAYSSWGLSDVERRRLYSQTEKEVLGIVWDCEKFHVYLYELVFWLWTDHKPLEFVYSEWSRPRARIEWWFSSYSRIFFSEIFAWANEHVDALSHRTIIEETRTRNVAENGVHQFVANTAELKAMTGEETEATSGVDDELESLRQCIKTGNWKNASCSDYRSVRDELCIFGNMVLRAGTRIAVQRKFGARVTGLSHDFIKECWEWNSDAVTRTW